MSDFARPSALAPFRIRNYRFQWPADLLTSWAFEMEMIILGWYVLVETGSVLLLTVFASLGYIGTLVAPMFGVVGDRIGHRDLLAMMRASYAVLATVLMTLALTGHLSPLFVFIVAALMGVVRPSDLGVRGALVATIMPRDQLIGAISISRTTMDTARIAGALSGAGLFAALGMGPAYVAIVCLYLIATVLTLCVVVSAKPHPTGDTEGEALRPSPLRDLMEGVAYCWTTPRMRAALWVAFLANLTAYPLTNGLLPYVAKTIYGTNQTGLGYLSASFAIGSLAGSIVLSLIHGIRVARLMIASTVLWYATLLLFVQMQTVPTAIVCLVIAGFSQSLAMISIAVILMRTAAENFRGRVMGVRMMVIYGLPFGLLAAGSLIDEIGFAATGTLYAAVGLALMLAIMLHWRADLWPAHAPANAR
ncbi:MULTISPECIES: MFS transporter [unclassified Bradyrhizobium]|uniref:MFS transporter n=1 Tax=unclassified Bradyrhizobium TaxID=2631580 RepID=UPI001BA7F778|nr:MULTISPECIES: MFS transporter [unclassified Bradyrhizobium]MBR1224583.1 MFS transporter [Bradyrhizobium sp. AUGA SZCCT0176]MBR1295883.1 MFS transporter [Bradyrhizobium sp. AUGA SZCCT0042]